MAIIVMDMMFEPKSYNATQSGTYLPTYLAIYLVMVIEYLMCKPSISVPST